MGQKVDVGQLIQDISRTKGGLPHLSELAEAFVREAGGADAMARHMWLEFCHAPQGSLVKTQLFGMISKVWKYSTDQLKTEDPESLSDADLDEEIKRVMLELFANAAEACADNVAKNEPPPPGEGGPAGAAGAGTAPAAGRVGTPGGVHAPVGVPAAAVDGACPASP